MARKATSFQNIGDDTSKLKKIMGALLDDIKHILHGSVSAINGLSNHQAGQRKPMNLRNFLRLKRKRRGL